ncbi:MAG TPA: O-antigen ligase [Candidatus Sulfotelmatobacter sp.]|jgi:exopolysaccharide production protein ExoQ|nr:O-antigen ligase [Candidatus Sulfotelmatobacter sp.]
MIMRPANSAAPPAAASDGSPPASPARGTYAKLNRRTAVLAVGVTLSALALNQVLGTLSILIMYPFWFSRLKRAGRATLRLSPAMVAVFAFPVWACLSTLWSHHPEYSLRFGLEFISMLMCTVIAARIIPTEELIVGIVGAIGFVMLTTLASGRYAQDYMTGETSLVGFVGAKNMVGLYATMGIYFSGLLLIRVRWGGKTVLLGLLTLLLSMIALYKARSATALVSLLAVCSIAYAMVLVGKLPKKLRKPLLIMTAVIAVVAVVAGANLGLQGDVLAALGKSSTLTGRTYLWSEGYKIGLQEPIIGRGYFAFWVQGEPRAERYWHEFTVLSRTGFHFHSMHVQTFVDLGLVGETLLALVLLGSFFKSLMRAARDGADAESLFCVGVSTFFLIRSFVEVDVLGPFSCSVFLLYSVLPRLEEYRSSPVLKAAAAPPPPRAPRPIRMLDAPLPFDKP